MKPRNYKSKVVQRMLKDMEKDPWHVKFRRWIRLQVWVYRCLIFNKSKNREFQLSPSRLREIIYKHLKD